MVQDENLVGCIVAGMKILPIAYLIPAVYILEDIAKSFGDAKTTIAEDDFISIFRQRLPQPPAFRKHFDNLPSLGASSTRTEPRDFPDPSAVRDYESLGIRSLNSREGRGNFQPLVETPQAEGWLLERRPLSEGIPLSDSTLLTESRVDGSPGKYKQHSFGFDIESGSEPLDPITTPFLPKIFKNRDLVRSPSIYWFPFLPTSNIISE